MQAGSGGIIANPNCSTIIALMAVTPLHRAKTVKRMVVSTYQAASGAGQAAMDELEAQTRAVLDGTPLPMEIFPFQYAFNLFSHNAPMQDNGYNEEVRNSPLSPLIFPFLISSYFNGVLQPITSTCRRLCCHAWL